MTEWFTVAQPARVAQAWPGAPEDQDEILGMLLDIAKEQVIAFAPITAFDLTDPLVPKPSTRLVYAQLQQAINLWNAGNVSSDGTQGPESYSFTPRPLDKTIRSIIRPQSGVPDVF